MSKKQSRRTQRAMEKDLFGPGPRIHLPRSPRVVAAQEPPPGKPGDCWACGNTCEPAYDAWTCPVCDVTYPVSITQEARDFR